MAIPNRIAVLQSPNSKALLESKAGRIKLWLMRRMAKHDEQVAHYLRMRELPIGARDTLVYTAKPPIEKHRFDGKCYLLMDGLSGSASVSMASVFRQYDRGLILGTPCLGPMSGTWGNPATVHLPETELDIVVSTLRFDATGHFDRTPTSILPDHWLAPTRLDVAAGTDVCGLCGCLTGDSYALRIGASLFDFNQRKHRVIKHVLVVGVDALADQGLARVAFDLLDTQKLHQNQVGK